MVFKEFIESREEMEQLLGEEVIGFLGLSADGELYVVPVNYAYVDGTISFHRIFGPEAPAFRRGEEGPPPFVLSDPVSCINLSLAV